MSILKLNQKHHTLEKFVDIKILLLVSVVIRWKKKR